MSEEKKYTMEELKEAVKVSRAVLLNAKRDLTRIFSVPKLSEPAIQQLKSIVRIVNSRIDGAIKHLTLVEGRTEGEKTETFGQYLSKKNSEVEKIQFEPTKSGMAMGDTLICIKSGKGHSNTEEKEKKQPDYTKCDEIEPLDPRDEARKKEHVCIMPQHNRKICKPLSGSDAWCRPCWHHYKSFDGPFKPCSRCGTPTPQLMPTGMVQCPHCLLRMEAYLWNLRPREDALKAELAIKNKQHENEPQTFLTKSKIGKKAIMARMWFDQPKKSDLYHEHNKKNVVCQALDKNMVRCWFSSGPLNWIDVPKDTLKEGYLVESVCATEKPTYMAIDIKKEEKTRFEEEESRKALKRMDKGLTPYIIKG